MKFAFVHMYGCVGRLEGMQNAGSFASNLVKFGHANDDIKFIGQQLESIKLISDRGQRQLTFSTDISDKVVIFGYGLDAINNRRLGLENLTNIRKGWSSENLIFNIYPGVIPNFDFSVRRLSSEKVRSIAIDADIQYRSSREFLHCALRKQEVKQNFH